MATAIQRAPIIVQRVEKKKNGFKRRAGALGAAAWKEKAPLGAFGGGALLGYAESAGWLDKLPELGGLPKTTVGGVALYFATRNNTDPRWRAAGLSGLALAGYALGVDWGKPK